MLSNKVAHLSRLADNSLKIKMIKEELEKRIERERQEREELALDLMARVALELGNQHSSAERRIKELEDNLQKQILAKAEASDL
jgi:hypothetical protein